MLDTLLGFQERCDDNASRFPNFSTLVVNALCACLDTASDPLVKRSALDLLSNYLKMTNRQIMGKQEAVVLVQAMLQLLKGKEYSLTNRVYKYLFDQPDAEGFFMVDNESKKY